jgi:hypothetical protein
MKASEGRIGNWVQHSQNEGLLESVRGKLHQLVSLDFFSGFFFEQNFYEGIPLTKELLTEWLGFEQIEIDERLFFTHPEKKLLCGHSFELGYYEFSGDSTLDGFYFYAGHPYDTHVKTLHQLQNLFFALTGTELQIKIPQ